MNAQYEVVKNSIVALSSVCDGAQKDDGFGFNGADAHFGHNLADRLSRYDLTPKQQAAAIKMLQKYRGQLSNLGIENLPTIDEYTVVGDEPKAKEPLTVTVANGQFGVSIPRHLNSKREEVKTLEGRRFDWDKKVWLVPAAHGGDLLRMLPDAQWSDDARVLAGTEQEMPRVKIQILGSDIVLDFPYFNRQWVDAVKSLPERKFKKSHYDSKNVWLCPLRMAGQVIALFDDADIEPEVTEIAKKQRERAAMAGDSDAEFDVPLAFGTLKNYQRAGVEFLELAHGRAIIADEMGLGKTLQSIAYVINNPDDYPVVVVVPASLKINWQREFKKFANIDAHIISGTKTGDLPESRVYIINYDILTKWTDAILKLGPKLLIADEAHYAKNTKSQRTKALQGLAKRIYKTILLTGTPITNRPKELWPLLNMVDSAAWPKFFPFARRYCGAYKNEFGWNFDGATNLKELNEAIKPYMVRRLKSQVLSELPEKQRVTIPMELKPAAMRAYRSALDEARAAIKAAKDAGESVGAEHLALIEKAKQAAVDGKLPQAIEWIKNFVDSGEKLIVFCTHKFAVQRLMDEFSSIAVKVTGDDSQAARQAAVDAFQSDDGTKLFVGNIKAAGVGLTLTEASNVAFLEFAWTPGDHAQAEDRAHRIGQQSNVTAWYLVAANTIDEDIVSLLEDKRQVVDMATDGRADGLKFSVFNELVKKLGV